MNTHNTTRIFRLAILGALLLMGLDLLLGPCKLSAASGDAVESGKSGIELFNQGDWAGGAKALESAVSQTPDDLGLRVTYAVALLQSKDYEGALNQLQKASDMEPGAAIFRELATTVASERSESGQPPLIAAGANSFTGRVSFGAMAKVGSIDSSIQVLEKAAQMHPQSAPIANLLADAYQLKGDFAQAESWYKKATSLSPVWVKPMVGFALASLDSDTPRAVNLLEQASAADPGNPRIKLWLGDAYTRLGRMQDATRAYTEASKSTATAADSKVRLGTLYLRTQQAPAAARLYSDANKIDSSNVAASVGQAQILAQSKPEMAQDAMQVAIANSSASSEQTRASVYFNNGETLAANGQIGEAVVNYEKAVELNPTSQKAYARLAGSLKQINKLREVNGEYEARLRESPGDVSALRFLAEGYDQSGMKERQLVVLGRLSSLDPANRWSWLMRQAEVYWDKGDRANALAKWREAVDVGYPTRTSVIAGSILSRPGAVAALQSAAVPSSRARDKSDSREVRDWHLKYAIALAQGKLQEAKRCLDKAISLDASNPSLYGQRGVLLQRMGQNEPGMNDFDTQRELLVPDAGTKQSR